MQNNSKKLDFYWKLKKKTANFDQFFRGKCKYFWSKLTWSRGCVSSYFNIKSGIRFHSFQKHEFQILFLLVIFNCEHHSSTVESGEHEWKLKLFEQLSEQWQEEILWGNKSLDFFGVVQSRVQYINQVDFKSLNHWYRNHGWDQKYF